jgi:hypothetical protein
MHSAPMPQSESMVQLITATHWPVKKSHVVPIAQSASLVQLLCSGTHWPPTHCSFGLQSLFDMHFGCGVH